MGILCTYCSVLLWTLKTALKTKAYIQGESLSQEISKTEKAWDSSYMQEVLWAM